MCTAVLPSVPGAEPWPQRVPRCGQKDRHLISAGLPTWHLFHQQLLEIFAKWKNKGRSLPWPPACLASRSYLLVLYSSCILERTQQNDVKFLHTLHFNPWLSICRPWSLFDPRHTKKWFKISYGGKISIQIHCTDNSHNHITWTLFGDV